MRMSVAAMTVAGMARSNKAVNIDQIAGLARSYKKRVL